MTERVDTEREEAPKKVKRDRTHWLYILVIIGVVAGIVVGLLAPDTGNRSACSASCSSS
jgi:aerobic C4-dicarboxylate transport protein